MNLHSLDGQLEKYSFASDYSATDEQLKVLRNFKDYVPVPPQYCDVIDTIIADVTLPPNQDTTNNLSVDHLLYEIYHFHSVIKLGIDLDLLYENLREMRTGMCPEGRSIRLLYVIFAALS